MIKSNERVSELDGSVTNYLTMHSLYQQAVTFTLKDQNLLQQTFESCMKCITDENSPTYKKTIELLYLWEQTS